MTTRRNTLKARFANKGRLLVIDMSANKSIARKQLGEINAQVFFRKAVLGVVVVDCLEMHMNHPQLYRNCVFVTKPNLAILLKLLGVRMDEIFKKLRPHGTPLSEGVSELRNSAEVLAVCLREKADSEPCLKKNRAGPTSRGWYKKRTPQSDGNDYFSLPNMKKVLDEDRDFLGHHDFNP
jgi:hypothetical protein